MSISNLMKFEDIYQDSQMSPLENPFYICCHECYKFQALESSSQKHTVDRKEKIRELAESLESAKIMQASAEEKTKVYYVRIEEITKKVKTSSFIDSHLCMFILCSVRVHHIVTTTQHETGYLIREEGRVDAQEFTVSQKGRRNQPHIGFYNLQ